MKYLNGRPFGKNPRGSGTGDLLKRLVLILICPIALFSATVPCSLQVEQDELKEYVKVTHVEVFVRVKHKGQPVGGLKETDFNLFENGKRRPITSFQEVRRKIGTTNVELLAEKLRIETQKPRLFLIYFWIAEQEMKYMDALNYFFKNVYRRGDRVLLIMKNNVFQIVKDENIENSLAQLQALITREAGMALSEKIVTARNLRNQLNPFVDALQNRQQDPETMDILMNNIKMGFVNAWREFINRHLRANVTKLLALADSLKDLNIEKWGIVFYQHDAFPHYDALDNVLVFYQGNVYAKRLLEMMRGFYLETQKPINTSFHLLKQVQQAFITANTTFHLLLMESKKILDQEYADVTMKNIYSDWQETFRSISQVTGGEILESTRLTESMARVVEYEDIYYRITYSQDKNGKAKGGLKISTTRPQYNVFYASHAQPEKTIRIAVSGLSLNQGVLTFVLKNYQRIAVEDKQIGRASIIINAVSNEGEKLEFEKELTLETEESQVSLRLNFPYDSTYVITVTAIDEYTGESAKTSRVVAVDIDERKLFQE